MVRLDVNITFEPITLKMSVSRGRSGPAELNVVTATWYRGLRSARSWVESVL